ncbi:Nrap protein [Wallemia mellicola]|uniref:U3 small nucleolar RNA-associated protein 22 n=1 Tax=Wallemia mellicola TaxID=1708541 RepID=A0AB38MYK7_9BASI|nr:Nrap protein [Wallemia mellicola]
MVKRNREVASGSESESDFDYENMGNYEEPNEFEDSGEEQMDVDDTNIKSNGGAFKAPTKDEVQSLRETGELFKSNFFKLQIDSLLEEIQQPASQVETLTQALHALRNLIMETKPIGKSTDGKLSTSDARKYLRKNNLSLPVSKELPEDVNWAVGYTLPDIVQVAGSWPLKTNVKRRSSRVKSWEVTLAILLPSHFIQEKDHQNDRWLFKQAFYMTVLADILKKSKLDIQVDITQANGSELEPVISITNKKGSKFIPSNTTINLVSALASPTPFKPLSKISPSRIGSKLSNAFMKPSLHTPHLTYLYNIAETVPAFRDAVKLLKVWANQRSLDWLLNGFNAEFVVALLVDGDQDGKGRVGKGLSSYQLFKTVMDLLRKTDFTSVFMKSITTGGFSKEDHFNSTPLLFIDPTHTYNLMDGLLPEDARVIGFEAQLTLNALDDDNDRFEDTFMKDLRNPTARFDLIGKGKLPSKLVKKIAKGTNVRQNIAATLARALGERSKVINVKLDDDMISIGLILDSEVAGKIVDHGPPAEDEEGCEVFKAFWGEISELRRFKDGKINESVVWQQSNGSKELVPIQIVKWILRRHFNIDQLSFIAEEFDGLLEVEAVDGVETFNDFGAPLQVYEDFQSMLRDMTTLPLEIMNVTPASAYLRHTSPYPQPTRQMNKFGVTPTSARYIPGADLVVQFESSGKWPDDLEAIQITKVAFLEALAAELMKSGQYMAQIVFDSPLPSDIADAVALEVINEQGFAWKLRIQHDRELTLIDRQLNDKVNTTNSQKEILKEARHRFLERFVNKPRHHQAIMALTHRFKAYAKTVRLVSRWMNAHLLSPHISQEFIELVVAGVFLDTGSYSVPCTPSLGFLRSVLLLSEWKYKQEPLLVPLYTASQIQEDHLDRKIVFPLKEKTEAEKTFEVLRRTDEDIKKTAMFVATEHDVSGGHYTHDRPSKVIASRLQSLAKATASALLDDSEVDIMQLFKSPTEIYDFVINLKSWVNTRLYQSLAEDNFGDVDTSNDALVNYDPATMFVEYMERMYGDVVVFFHDACGGRVIGAMFNPAYTSPRKWKVGLHYPTKSVDSKDDVVIDKKFIIKEITTLGKDMIESVTSK